MMLTFSRWIVCCARAGLEFAARDRRRTGAALLPSWRSIALMGTLGFTGFNALFYAAAHHTTAINIAIIQGTIPVLVLLGGFIFFGSRIGALQIVGVLLTLAGIVVVASRGQLALLAGLAFNIGDVWIIAGLPAVCRLCARAARSAGGAGHRLLRRDGGGGLP